MKTYLLIAYVLMATFLDACGPSGATFSGKDGQSCTVSQVDEGALIQCPDGTKSLVSNGTNGTNGNTLTAQPFCPTKLGVNGFQESYFTLNNGLYAVYYDGSHTFLVKLRAGNYVTTDGANCSFTINVNNTITVN